MPRRSKSLDDVLSRRERQVMDVIHRLGAVTARDLKKNLPDAPGYSAVRSVLRTLERKGHVTHRLRGTAHVYSPVERPSRTRRAALSRLRRTLFEGRPESVVSTLVDLEAARMSDEAYERLIDVIERARHERRARRGRS
jgi:predicted transcriptional regulator